MRSVLCEEDYGFARYLIEKETTEMRHIISVYRTRNDDKRLVQQIYYDNIGKEYFSKYLSWRNLIFHSNTYGVAPKYDDMNCAVQEGRKPAATLYINEDDTIIHDLPNDCGYMVYDESLMFVFRRNTLSELFDFDAIREIYMSHGCDKIDWEKVRDFFEKPLSFFGKRENCGFNLQSGGTGDKSVVTGLILGYPIESTIAFIKHQI